MGKHKDKKSKDDEVNKKESWKHSASEKEVNALRAMMKKNAQLFKKKIDDQKNEEE